jgi:chemotaxis-related protein WspB
VIQRSGEEERLVTFEVCGAAYALPIGDVLEVADLSRMSCIPMLPLRLGGVMNLHGDALPVIERSVLFEVVEGELTRPEHLLVIGGRRGELAGNLGVPVDRILGIHQGRGGAARDPSGVVERRPMDGRVVTILDTRRLLERAAAAIERAVDRVEPRANDGGRV